MHHAVTVSMSRCVVTGAAGFIGSHLSAALLDQGHEVFAVDNFADYYARAAKERNVGAVRSRKGYQFEEADLLTADLPAMLAGADVVFHEAGQPGVRASWGTTFEVYCNANVLVTQRLLEACRDRPLTRFVYASSSSVYGNAEDLPVVESSLPRPVSPYGVSKLAGEHLCVLYAAVWGLPTVALRYFTVYGPRQRPDMAFNKFIRAILTGKEINIFGDGTQTRDFTYVDDIVAATIAAGLTPGLRPGAVYNLGGGLRISLNDVISVIAGIAGRAPVVTRAAAQAGDVRDTFADCTLARADLGYEPTWSLNDGLAAEVDWMRRELVS